MNKFFAEQRPGASRASAILSTQAEAIARAEEIDPNAEIMVEHVRNTSVGGRYQWRKP